MSFKVDVPMHYTMALLRNIAITVLAAASFSVALAQTDQQRAQNLATCLGGRYPTLCKQGWLSPDERSKVDQAERRENLRTCMTGRYINLCNKALLTERERTQVLAAELAENLQTCSTGLYPVLCNRSLLTTEQLTQVQAAEARARSSKPAATRASRGDGRSRGYSLGCEDGHWIDSVSDDGTIVKLEDGSVWDIDAVDAIDSALWLPTTEIVACDDKLINTDDNEKVAARRLR